MTDQEFEAIKNRVEAGTNADGSWKAGLAGNEAQASAPRDLRALVTEIERLRGSNDV